MIILLDEIDKIDSVGVESTLINILDYSQNNKFKDLYMPEIPIDLSKIIFVLSANNLEHINKALLDRMHIINIDGYVINDKISISENFIIPKIIKRLAIDKNSIVIEKETIKYLINKIDEERGLRKIEKFLDQIYDRIMLLKNCREINFSFKLNKPIVFPFKITNKDIDILIKN